MCSYRYNQINPSTIVRAAPSSGSRPNIASVLQESEKSANIHVRSGAIWRIPVQFPARIQKIPCSVAWGICLQALESADRLGAKIAQKGRNLQISLLISLLAGNFAPRPVRGRLSRQPASPVPGVLFPGGGESPTFPQVRLGCPSLWSAISGISALAGRVSLAPVSGGDFPISVSGVQRPVRQQTESCPSEVHR